MRKRKPIKGRTESRGPRSAVIYARVSSKEQEKDGFSIPSQLKLLREYAATHGYTIVREFTDIETAKRTGRTEFGKMQAFLKASKSSHVVLVEKTDRLYRNIRDWVTLEDLELEIHLVKENVILSRDSRSSEKFMHGIKVLMAKNYIDNLSEEVRKGMTEKAEQGHWPSVAPLGYRNNLETHRIEPDPVEGPLVTRLFEMASDPRMTYEKLAEQIHAAGLRSRRLKGRFNLAGVQRVLSNTIYWGMFSWNGRVYAGHHEPLITKNLFDQVQMARQSRSKPRRRNNHFAFAGLASCTCGKRLCGQLAKRTYVYYGCSQRCGATPLIRERDLSAMFLKHLEAIRVTDEVAAMILDAIKAFEGKRRADRDKMLSGHQERQRRVQKLLDAAYDDKLAGRIDEAYWLRRTSEWQAELAEARAEIRILETVTFDTFKRTDQILKLCQKAPDLFMRQSFDEQARLVSVFCSSSLWDGVTLSPIYKKPFDMLVEGLIVRNGGAEHPLYPNFRRFWRGVAKSTTDDLGRLLAGEPTGELAAA